MNIQDYFCTFVLDPKQNKNKSEPKAIKIRHHPDFFFFFFYLQNCLFLVSIKLKTKKNIKSNSYLI